MEKVVTFPGLGLEFQLNPIALPITESFGIHWYGAIIAVGFLLAVLWCSKQKRRFGISQDNIYDLLIAAVPLSIIGARLYYVIFEFENYYEAGDIKQTLVSIVRIWDGGLAIYGGVIAAVLTTLVFCKVKKIRFLAFADLGAMGLFIGQLVGRWGNFVNVEAFGSVTDVPWRMAGPNVAGYLQRTGQIDAAVYEQIVDGTLGVHPTFFYESAWNLIGLLLVVLIFMPRRKFDGQMFFFYLAWYGAGRFWIEGLRTDSLFVPGTALRVSQALALVSALFGIGCMLYIYFIRKPMPEDLYVNQLKEKEEDGDVGQNS